MSIRNRRAGRKSWNTRIRFEVAVSDAVVEIGKLQFKYSNVETKAMVIEREANGMRQTITFSTAYGELSGWVGKTFSNHSDLGLSDSLVEMFRSGASIHTRKAVYRLWTPRRFAARALISSSIREPN